MYQPQSIMSAIIEDLSVNIYEYIVLKGQNVPTTSPRELLIHLLLNQKNFSKIVVDNGIKNVLDKFDSSKVKMGFKDLSWKFSTEILGLPFFGPIH